MNSKMFPIQKSNPIPWEEAERAYRTYARLYGGNQSLERLAERGGFGVREFSCYWHGHEPNRDCTHGYPLDRVAKLETRISELEAQLAVEKKKVAALEKPAAFGWQCYQDRCENAHVEQSVVRKMEAKQKAAREAGAALLDAMEYCHNCGGQIALDEADSTHCENCSWDCDQHDEPACTPIYVLHDRLRKALAALDGEVR